MVNEIVISKRQKEAGVFFQSIIAELAPKYPHLLLNLKIFPVENLGDSDSSRFLVAILNWSIQIANFIVAENVGSDIRYSPYTGMTSFEGEGVRSKTIEKLDKRINQYQNAPTQQIVPTRGVS